MSSPCHIELWLTEGETAAEAPKKATKKKGALDKAKRSKQAAAVAH